MNVRLRMLLVACCCPILAVAQQNAPFVPPDPDYSAGQTETIESIGVSVTYIDLGEGTAILPFMYTGGGFVYWQSLIEAARSNHRVLAPDARSYSLPQLQMLIEHAQAGPVDLVTHSAAAWLGIHFAARHPELVNSLILLEPAYAPDIDTSRRSAAAYRTSCELSDPPAEIMFLCQLINGTAGPGYFERMPPEYLALVANQAINRPMAEAILESGLAIPGADLRSQGWMFDIEPICDVSASLTMPILIVRGAVSTESNRIDLDAHEACLPPHRTIVIDDATHFAHLERPDEFNAAVLDFVAAQHTAR